jgi:proline iminopeptidase
MWQPHQIEIEDGILAWEEAGQGEPLLFLAGGPGDAATYLRPVAEPLTTDYRCILFDQRGTGRSLLNRHDEATLALERYYEDIERLRERFGVEQLTIVGHSWGAMLALFFAMHYPHRVKRMIFIGCGPLDAEGSAIAGANSLKPLTMAERAEVEQLSTLRKTAQAAQDWESVKQYHIESVRLRARAWFYSEAVAAEFAEEWAQNYSLNPMVHQIVNQHAKQLQVWGNIGHITAPTLVIYGYQDFEPITQAYRLKAEMPDVTVRMVNEAGHDVWLEQPEWLEREMKAFLRNRK